MTLPNGTLLVLTPISGSGGPELSPYSARNLTQTLAQISSSGRGSGALGSWLRRDVNGVLQNLAPTQFQKYESVISCSDQDTPAFDDAWYGAAVEVQCAAELSFLTGGTPQRPEVSGSSRVAGSYTFYRPILNMRVYDIRNAFTEWGANYRWQISLQEI